MIGRRLRSEGLVAVVVMLAAFAIVIGVRLVGASLLGWEISAFERDVGSLDVSAYETPTPGPDDAATWLRAGAEALTTAREDRALVGQIARVPVADWGAEEAALVRRVVEEQAEGLSDLHRAGRADQARFGMPPWNPRRGKRTELLAFMNAARLLAAEAKLAVYEDRRTDALAPAAALERLATGLQLEPDLTPGIIGVGAERLLVRVVADAVVENHVGRETVHRLAALLPDGDPVERVVSDVVARAAIMTHLHRSGAGGSLWWHPLAPSAVATALGGYRHIIEAAHLPHAERDLDDILGPRAAWYRPHRRLLWIGAPSLNGQISRAQVLAAERQLVRAAVAVWEVGDEQGAYTGRRPAVEPLERPDPLRGEMISYEVLEDGSVRLSLPGGREIADRIAPAGMSFLGQIVVPP